MSHAVKMSKLSIDLALPHLARLCHVTNRLFLVELEYPNMSFSFEKMTRTFSEITLEVFSPKPQFLHSFWTSCSFLT